MQYLMAPLWFPNFLENDKVSWTRRETRCRNVLGVSQVSNLVLWYFLWLENFN